MQTIVRYVVVLLLLYSNDLFAQNAGQAVRLLHYVFNGFTPGTVKMRSGETFSRVLNYNILTGEMIFDNNGNFLAIADPQKVDTVYISNRKFIPLNAKFYEVLLPTPMPLLLEFTFTIKEPGTEIGYGITTTTSATTALTSLINSGGAYRLTLPDDFKVLPGYVYWISKNGNLEKAGSVKQLIKIFPDKKDRINDLVKTNDVNFSERENVISLVRQVEQ